MSSSALFRNSDGIPPYESAPNVVGTDTERTSVIGIIAARSTASAWASAVLASSEPSSGTMIERGTH